MKNFPSKITSIHDSVIWTMTIVLKNIPWNGITVNKLKKISGLDIDDFLQAVTYLYALKFIKYDEKLNSVEKC